MHIPLAKYGAREILFTALVCIILGAVFWFLQPRMILLPMILFLFVLSFFRNPNRQPPGGPLSLLSPADGTVVALEEINEPLFIQGRALKIGIFLSIFNAHVNRAPLTGIVNFLQYNPGKFLNAIRKESAEVNENNYIGMDCDPAVVGRILVKQISGVIARRIVVDVTQGQSLERGQILGMIKFGSRTEVYIPVNGPKKFQLQVKIKDTVKAGLSILGEWQ